jgi:arabinose-5-phosphate isomerase
VDYQNIAREVLEKEAEELKKAARAIDEQIERAIETIYATEGKLIVTGVGKSGLVGAKIAATLASTGTSSFFLHPTEAMHGDLGMIGKGDTVLAISYSGESEELSNILPHIKRFNIPLIGMSRDKGSTLGQYSDIFLNIAVEYEACPLDSAPTSSTTLTMALGDALAVCLMKKRGFQKEDFASFHPGGSLGKRLYVKVLDLAKTKGLPIISPEATIKDAILKIGEGRLGNVFIVEDQKLIGLLSDGDIRRALTDTKFSRESLAIDYATTDPINVNADMLASDVLKIIEENKIQVASIIDEERRLIGAIHLHDLVEAGIK